MHSGMHKLNGSIRNRYPETLNDRIRFVSRNKIVHLPTTGIAEIQKCNSKSEWICWDSYNLNESTKVLCPQLILNIDQPDVVINRCHHWLSAGVQRAIRRTWGIMMTVYSCPIPAGPVRGRGGWVITSTLSCMLPSSYQIMRVKSVICFRGEQTNHFISSATIWT